MGVRDWMPRRRDEQLALARTWLGVLPVRGSEWGVTGGEVSELTALSASAEEAQKQAQAGDGNRTLNALEREAFVALVKFMRVMRRRRFTTPPFIESDWVSLGLRPPDTVRTPHIVVNEVVDFVLRVNGIREIAVDFWIQGATHRAKPAGYDGAVVVWGLRDTQPEHPDDLNFHSMASRTPYTLQFEEADRGKTVWVALSWQNKRGIIGPWSEYKSAIVP